VQFRGGWGGNKGESLCTSGYKLKSDIGNHQIKGIKKRGSSVVLFCGYALRRAKGRGLSRPKKKVSGVFDVKRGLVRWSFVAGIWV